jgi:divalent metal cation (Fe/Co/Zn/Cd) transporter
MAYINQAPKALQIAFVAHFIIDWLFAIPLLIFPETFLGALGWQKVDPVATRLVAAALAGIGLESLLGRTADIEVFKGMLNLKIIWSSVALLGLTISIIQQAQNNPWLLIAILIIFMLFNLLWLYWRIRLAKK